MPGMLLILLPSPNHIQVLPNDEISKVICNVCWTQVSEFHQFYVSIQEAQVIYATTSKFKQDPEMVNTSWPEEVLMPADVLAVDNDVSAQLNVNPLDELDLSQPMSPEDSKVGIKTERESPDMEFIFEDANNDHDEDYEEDEDEDTDDLIVTRSGRKRKVAKPAKTKRGAGAVGRKGKEKITAKRGPPKRIFKMERLPPFCKEDEELIKRYIVMGCELCIFLAEDFDGIREHFKEKHPEERPFIKCCGRKLNKRCLIQEHARRHENPEYIKWVF